LCEEEDKRNMAFYVREPQKLIFESKGKLFLDPSYSYRLDLMKYNPKNRKPPFTIRFLTEGDIPEVNRIYEESGSLPIGTHCTIKNQRDPSLTYFIAESEGKVLGVMTGIDHAELFNSPKEGTSIWGLCISKDARKKGLGRSLMGYIAKHYKTRGRRFLDLSVLCKNKAAIALYEKMGFVRMKDCFCVKTKNEINSGLYY
jgi:ribosomal protein S18 acetylase RimI-like enzyme